ncbi:hypothetical protein NQZ79_g2700 [Umbelopsis isabellina]|nr:hypothetical protein NQZ79_g2700 [Umbelopsis isabellina]
MSYTGKGREGYFDSDASVPWTANHRQQNSASRTDISPIPQRLSVSKDKHRVHPSFRNENQIKIDTNVQKFKQLNLSPQKTMSPLTPPSCDIQLGGSLLSPGWLDVGSACSSPISPTSFAGTDPATPSPTRSKLTRPVNLLRSSSSQTAHSAAYYGRSSIEKNFPTVKSTANTRDRKVQDISSAHMIATTIPPSSKSTPTQRKDERRPAAHNSKQLVRLSEAEAHVQKGIKYHEGGQLEKATQHFRAAADRDSPMGMFLYGISLRHGWYLQKTAEHAVDDLNNLSVNLSASKGELVMAIYELGVSFRHGWGVQKDKQTACYYFKIAAELASIS